MLFITTITIITLSCGLNATSKHSAIISDFKHREIFQGIVNNVVGKIILSHFSNYINNVTYSQYSCVDESNGKFCFHVNGTKKGQTLVIYSIFKDSSCAHFSRPNSQLQIDTSLLSNSHYYNFKCIQEQQTAIVNYTIELVENVPNNFTLHILLKNYLFHLQYAADFDNFLVLYFDKNSADNSPDYSHLKWRDGCNYKKECCLVSFNVSIAELGWQQVIVAPKHLPVSMCIGVCNENAISFDINVILLQQIKKMYILSKTPQLKSTSNMYGCCAAVSYTQVGIIFVNPSDELVQDALDIIANDCACL